MLKVRLIPVLLLKGGRMVKPVQFGSGGERDVGWPITTARIYNSQDADELIFLDIEASQIGRNFLLDTLREVARECFVPLTAGGGIRDLETIREMLAAGADKVSVNSYAVESPSFIEKAADMFGSQCIVVSIDAKKRDDGTYEVFTNRGRSASGLLVVEWAKRAAELGAGELLITSIDREGTLEGYDLDLVSMVADSVVIPVIANGGAGTRQHFVDAVRKGHASAVAASSIFHFTDSNLTQVKSFIYNAGIPIRSV
ncbi:imidazole glycerol phosphate synthase subunit HisF [Candidatus Kaiserbacteria bacterium RIFCSPLOWO2_01_FULL_54_13]|uniref:imidazole glycerol-phosphate synthase n=1 Tax=Candidatus Kaiserbacteria bacterium RIFCSPLOWO2_01_FULL_54_13 TaxID=1798512 RepID=A0A1F6F139_9BACT|nr:MAG: imidazole glycerol phosphate synthase subunit HisF [Candidatus Kaiserbacteria bacterium RIFCSPLOWO2_01_FULL_54_13]